MHAARQADTSPATGTSGPDSALHPSVSVRHHVDIRGLGVSRHVRPAFPVESVRSADANRTRARFSRSPDQDPWRQRWSQLVVLPQDELYVVPFEQWQTPWVCDGFPVQPGLGACVQPQGFPEHGAEVEQRRPVAQETERYPVLQGQVLLAPQLELDGQRLSPQLIGKEPQLAGTLIAHG